MFESMEVTVFLESSPFVGQNRGRRWKRRHRSRRTADSSGRRQGSRLRPLEVRHYSAVLAGMFIDRPFGNGRELLCIVDWVSPTAVEGEGSFTLEELEEHGSDTSKFASSLDSRSAQRGSDGDGGTPARAMRASRIGRLESVIDI